MSDASRLKATVYVGGLDNAVNERILMDAFLPFGEVVEVSIPKPDDPSSTDPHRGFGYVEFEVSGDAKEAIDNMDQTELFGRVLRVAAAKPQKENNEGLNSKVAVWEQEGWLARHTVNEEETHLAKTSHGSVEHHEAEDDRTTGLAELDIAGPQPV